VAYLAEQVLREGHAFERRACLELAMQVSRYIPDLNHDRHVLSMLSCKTHVNRSSTHDPARRVAQTFAFENEFGCPMCRVCTWGLLTSVWRVARRFDEFPRSLKIEAQK
jgi:hypothetical protein